MAERNAVLREAIRRPLMLPYHPLYRFYEGGSLTRRFRGLPDRPDDWWSEDWVGSTTIAGNDGPDGQRQGASVVEAEGIGRRTILELIEADPEAMVGTTFSADAPVTNGVLVKLLSPAGQVPLHAHPTREWAARHLGSPFGKTEAWILLDTPGDGVEPAYAGMGFQPGVTRDDFRAATLRHDREKIRETLHRTEIKPGEVYVAHAGVPHYLGPRISFIEVQEPSDHIVIPETDGSDDSGATMGLGWDTALDMIDYSTADAASTFARARQVPTEIRRHHESTETRLFASDVVSFFDATRLDVADEIDVGAGRFSVDIVVSGDGFIEGDFGRMEITRGQSFACPAILDHRFVAGTTPMTVVRAMGPVASGRAAV
jgi:mannose-6-phosphate isomerase